MGERVARITMTYENGETYELTGDAAHEYDENVKGHAVLAWIHGQGMPQPLPWKRVTSAPSTNLDRARQHLREWYERDVGIPHTRTDLDDRYVAKLAALLDEVQIEERRRCALAASEYAAWLIARPDSSQRAIRAADEIAHRILNPVREP